MTKVFEIERSVDRDIFLKGALSFENEAFFVEKITLFCSKQMRPLPKASKTKEGINKDIQLMLEQQEDNLD